MIRTALAVLLLPTALAAEELIVENPRVPLAPPGVMAHAAYFTLTNTGAKPRRLIGIAAEGYMMAHIHKTEVKDDVATMAPIDLIQIAPGQSIVFEQGGLHVMLMRPAGPLEDGGTVDLTLEFANGEKLPVAAKVMRMTGSAQEHGS